MLHVIARMNRIAAVMQGAQESQKTGGHDRSTIRLKVTRLQT